MQMDNELSDGIINSKKTQNDNEIEYKINYNDYNDYNKKLNDLDLEINKYKDDIYYSTNENINMKKDIDSEYKYNIEFERITIENNYNEIEDIKNKIKYQRELNEKAVKESTILRNTCGHKLNQ